GPAAAKAPLERAEAAAAPSITPVVLAGGSGAPLWPLATAATPKQFLRLTGARSLLQETLLRVSDPALFHPPLLVCGAADHAVAAAQAAEVGLSFGTVILEPEARQSAPALAAAALSVAERDPNALLLASPADHAIREAALFPRLVDGAADAARRGSIVAFGVAAARPETRYGYVRVGAPAGVGGAFEIAEFVEKPELERARAMVGSGGYLWNSGIYLCRASDLLDELRRWCAGAVDAARAALDAGARDEPARLGDPTVLRLDAAAFAAAPARSIDVAVMERTERAVVCPAALTWSDVGGWDAIAMAQEGDEAGNIAAGRVTLMDCEGVYARSEGPRIAAIGLRDAVVVATADTVLVTTRDKADQVARIAPRAEECAVAQETTAQETTAQETAARERDARARRDEDQAAAERRDASSEPSARVAAAPSAGGRR
ncbi:MAG: sugar phosphate nucleotidyltransferase, partial [Pseudomonadota bacterium]